jgi:hypothetical protein
MANPIAAISNVQQITAATQAAAPKPPANLAKTTPQDSINISAAGAAANKASASTSSTDKDHDGDSK